jgi:hypothetical protein
MSPLAVPTMTRRPPYLSYLRVFEPVDRLPTPERARWRDYARSGPPRRDVEARSFADLVRRLAGNPQSAVPASESPDALVLADGGLWVCPQQPRLQVWRLCSMAPEDVAPGVSGVPGVPPAARERAAADLAAHLAAGGESRLFTRTAAWGVPISWFVPFTGADRSLELGPDRALRYDTVMAAARRRAAKALRTAREGLGDQDVVDEIEQVARWLEDFHPLSRVELDYGGLVDLLDDLHLRGDDSASDVEHGLAAVAEGDGASAAAAYRRWTTRWDRVRMLSRAC